MTNWRQTITIFARSGTAIEAAIEKLEQCSCVYIFIFLLFTQYPQTNLLNSQHVGNTRDTRKISLVCTQNLFFETGIVIEGYFG